MDQLPIIRERRERIAALHAQTQQAYNEMEQTLKGLHEQLCVQHGQLTAYDEILKILKEEPDGD